MAETGSEISASARRTIAGAGREWFPHLALFLTAAGSAQALSALHGLLGPVTGETHVAAGASAAGLLAGLAAGAVRGRRGGAGSFTALLVAALFVGISPWILPFFEPLGGLVTRLAGESFFLLLLLRLTVALLAVAVPSIALGMFWSAHFRESPLPEEGRRSAALQIAVGSAGASLGWVLAGFRLLPAGGEKAIALSAGLCLLASALLSRLLTPAREREPVLLAAPEASPTADATIRRWGAVLWGAAVVAALLAWDRILGLLFGPFPESMSRTGGLFLAFVALGSLGLAWYRPAVSGPAAIAALCGAAGLASAGTFLLLDRLPLLYLSVAPLAGEAPLSFTLKSWGIAALVVAVPGLVLGALLTFLAAQPGTAGPRDSEESSWPARVLFGAALAAFVVPAGVITPSGFRSALLAAAGLLLAFSAVALALSRSIRPLPRIAGIAAALLVTLLVALRPLGGEPRLLTSGVHRYAREILSAFKGDPLAYRAARLKTDLAYYREGGERTVALERVPADVSPVLALTEEGVAVGTTSIDLVPQILAAEIPLLMRPAARSVFLAGYGTGIGAGSALLHPLVALDVAEPEAAVIDASRHFEPANRSPRTDPRMRVHVDDPRQVLRSKPPASYDVILCRPTLPEAASQRFLFTASFYRLAASRLRNGGLFAQSLQVAGLSAADVASVIATARSVFPDVVVMQTYYHELLVLGAAQPIRFDLERLESAMAAEKIKSDLGRLGFMDPASLVIRHRLSGKGLEAFARNGRLLTDSAAPLSWTGFRAGAGPVSDAILVELDRFSTGLGARIAPLPEGAPGNQRLAAVAQAAIDAGDAVRAADVAETLIARGDAADGHRFLGDAHYLRREQLSSVAEWHKALEADPRNVHTLLSLADYASDRRNYEGAEQYLKAAVGIAPEDPSVLFNHGRALFYLNRYPESEAVFKKVLVHEGENSAPLTLYYLGLIQKEKKNPEGAAEFLRRYLQWAYAQGRLTPVEEEVHLALSDVYVAMKLPDLAEQHRKAAEALEEKLKENSKSREKALIEMLGGS
jgi:spermidine synthase